MENKVNRTHVLVVPFPGEGHLNPMLQFSRRLVFKGLSVTFVITNFISNSKQLGSSIDPVQLDTISDGFDDGGFEEAGSMEAYLSKLHVVGPKALLHLLQKHQTSTNPVSFVVYEPFLAWALDVAKEFGLIAAAFFTHTCTVDYIFYNVYHKLLKMPVSSTPVLITGLPLLELQDLPSFVAVPGSYPANFEMAMSQFSNMDKADYILINTFYKLEEEVVDIMSKICNLLTIGPTVPSLYLDNRVANDDDYGLDLHGVDKSVSMNWLRNKPVGSVVYVSFGSIASLSNKQMMEITWGLKRTNFHFLWVVRTSEEEKLPEDFVEEVAVTRKGLIVNWSPQVKVLSSEAVGCFLTHCGWNSTIEALSLGVPMVTMPQWSDQPTNSKLVQDVWQVGIRARVDENGIVKREEIEFCIKEIMEGEKGKEMKKNSKKWRELAIQAVGEGGTTDTNINKLVSKLLSTN